MLKLRFTTDTSENSPTEHKHNIFRKEKTYTLLKTLCYTKNEAHPHVFSINFSKNQSSLFWKIKLLKNLHVRLENDSIDSPEAPPGFILKVKSQLNHLEDIKKDSTRKKSAYKKLEEIYALKKREHNTAKINHEEKKQELESLTTTLAAENKRQDELEKQNIVNQSSEEIQQYLSKTAKEIKLRKKELNIKQTQEQKIETKKKEILKKIANSQDNITNLEKTLKEIASNLSKTQHSLSATETKKEIEQKILNDSKKNVKKLCDDAQALERQSMKIESQLHEASDQLTAATKSLETAEKQKIDASSEVAATEFLYDQAKTAYEEAHTSYRLKKSEVTQQEQTFDAAMKALALVEQKHKAESVKDKEELIRCKADVDNATHYLTNARKIFEAISEAYFTSSVNEKKAQLQFNTALANMKRVLPQYDLMKKAKEEKQKKHDEENANFHQAKIKHEKAMKLAEIAELDVQNQTKNFEEIEKEYRKEKASLDVLSEKKKKSESTLEAEKIAHAQAEKNKTEIEKEQTNTEYEQKEIKEKIDQLEKERRTIDEYNNLKKNIVFLNKEKGEVSIELDQAAQNHEIKEKELSDLHSLKTKFEAWCSHVNEENNHLSEEDINMLQLIINDKTFEKYSLYSFDKFKNQFLALPIADEYKKAFENQCIIWCIPESAKILNLSSEDLQNITQWTQNTQATCENSSFEIKKADYSFFSSLYRCSSSYTPGETLFTLANDRSCSRNFFASGNKYILESTATHEHACEIEVYGVS